MGKEVNVEVKEIDGKDVEIEEIEAVEVDLVDEVIAEMERRNKVKVYEEQKEKIEQSRESIEKNENVGEAEKKMHLAKLDFNELQLNISMQGEEAVREMNTSFQSTDVKVNRLNLTTADGNGVIEMIVPVEGQSFDKMMEASAEHWEYMKSVIEESGKEEVKEEIK